MTKIYFIRHQAANVVSQYPFSQPPSQEQIDAIAQICANAHGDTHRKTGEAYWTQVVEFDVLGPNDVPAVPDQGDGNTENVGESLEFGASGTVVVKNP